MRIATWNLARARPQGWKIAPAIRETFQHMPADIWILTETHVDFVPASQYLPHASAFDASVHTSGEHWVILWSPYEPVQRLATRKPHLTVCCEIVLPIGPAILYGTVIPDGTAKSWQAHYDAITALQQDWQELRTRYPNHLFCAGGDFNQNRGGPHQYGTTHGRQRLTQALDDAHLRCLTEGDLVASGKLRQFQTIDHLCINPPRDAHATVGVWERTASNGIRMSDHNGVYLDLNL